MSIAETLTNSHIDDISLFIHCILERIPIIIIDKKLESIENILSSLPNLIPFRNTLVFYSDFIENEDYLAIREMEDTDFEISRSIFLCFPNEAMIALKSISDFKSWIIGYVNSDREDEKMSEIEELMYHKQDFFLSAKIENNLFNVSIIGKRFFQFDIGFEKWIYQNAIKNTEESIERMKRVISKNMNKWKIEHTTQKSIINFSLEEKELKENLIKKEITNFYQASKRAFSILSRIKCLAEYGFESKISCRTFRSTIAYSNSPIPRILEFILSEWNMDFSSFLNISRSSNFTDTFESLWG